MPVEQHRGLARRAQPFGVDQRIALAFDQLRLLQSGALQLAAHEFGRPLDVRLMLRQSADARDAQEGFQTFQITVVMLLVIVHSCLYLATRPTSLTMIPNCRTSVWVGGSV